MSAHFFKKNIPNFKVDLKNEKLKNRIDRCAPEQK